MESISHLSILKGPIRSLKSELNLCRLFEEVVVGSAEELALIFEDRGAVKTTSYHDLNATANRIARLIKATIVEKSIPRNADGDYIVAICMQPSDKLISVLQAVWKAGAAYLPLDPTFPASRIEHILRESKPALVIYENEDKSFGTVSKFSVKELFYLSHEYDSGNLEDRLSSKKDDLAIVL
ncbi:PREDICTED: dimodular nonribosomal peptide synthase-like, partial [Nicrophorus vespilloides]|uniref:Dimodular nonribosomal peptide synthase-like n=1 Tax=Nicrophorus vespilloides TaxID=110193 RepID=A0ABM1MAS0_NICVS